MKRRYLFLGGALLIATAVRAAGPEIYLFPMMKQIIAPQAQLLWDVGNRAYDDNGNVSVKNLTDADWKQLGEAAQVMKDAALAVAVGHGLTVAPEGTKLQDEGAPGVATLKEIQGFIDANPKDFADRARALADVSDSFVKAAQAKDGQTLADAAGKLDEVCEGCHVKYWYPQ